MATAKRVVVGLLLVCAAAIASSPTAARAQTANAKEVARRSLPAVVTIHTFDQAGRPLGLGSGFVAAPNGIVVTNHHVVDGAATATISLQSGEELRVQGVLEADVEKDFVLLKVRAVELPVLRLGNSDRVEPGEVVFALGAPQGFAGSVTVGNFSQMRRDVAREVLSFRMMQHSAAISPGSSGGPLVLETGEVVGVNTLSRTDGNSLYFALPINYVRAAIEDSAGGLVPLAELSGRVAAAREDAERERMASAIRENFVEYRDPDGLFSALVPRAWQVQRSVSTDADGALHVLVMAHDPDAQRAELNGWLSDGLRLQLEFPPRGQVWRTDAAPGWIAQSQGQMLEGYGRHEVVERGVVTVAGREAHRLIAAGTSPTLREAEVAAVYYFFNPAARAVVEFATPASKAKLQDAVRAVFESTLTIGWSRQ